MRITFITLGFCFAAAQANGQVGYRSTATPAANTALVRYDSTSDFENVSINVDPASMIGQQLYFPPGFKKDAGYSDEYNMFVDKKDAPVQEEKTKGKQKVQPPVTGRNDNRLVIYKPDPTRSDRTLRDQLENRYFTITGLKIEKTTEGFGGYVYSYELKDDAGEKIYYKVKRKDDNYTLEKVYQDGQTYGMVPFYIVGYIQKRKGNFVGKAFYKKDNTGSMYNYLTKERESVEDRKKYTCADYTFIDATARHAVPGFILKDEGGKELATIWYGKKNWYNEDKVVYVGDGNPGDMGYFWTEKQYQEVLEKERIEAEKKAVEAAAKRKADSIERKQDAAFRASVTKKYGAAVANKILEGKVDLGMTQDMCKIAWGQPSSVSKNTLGGVVLETWSYEWGRHLTFKNGKLSGFSE